MAFGDATFVGMPYSGLGKTFVGGLLSSTFITLVFVPVVYSIFERRKPGAASHDTSEI